MFTESILETSWGQRVRRGWMTLGSFGLQVFAIGVLLLLPLWKTVGLPAVDRKVSTPVMWGPGGDPAPVRRTGVSTPTRTPIEVDTGRLMMPTQIPTRIARGGPEPTTNGGGDPAPGPFLPGGPGGGSPDGLRVPGLPSGLRVVMPVAPPTVTHVFKQSSFLEGNLVRRVQPVYPPLARTARIQGPVVVYAMINRAGTMDNVRAISGHPMLVPAAVEAVSQWRYRPYVLNGEPNEVETQITVNFYLGN